MRIIHRFLIILVILLVSSVTMSVFAHFNTRFPGDLWLAQGIQSFSNDFLSSIMQGLSQIFDTLGSIIIVILTGLLLWWRTGWKDAVLVVVGGLLSARDPTLLTGGMITIIVDGCNHGRSPIAPTGHGFQTMFAQGCQFDESVQDSLEFPSFIKGGGIDLFHGIQSKK